MIQLNLFTEVNGDVISELTMEVDGIEFRAQQIISPLTHHNHLKYGTIEDLEKFTVDRLKISLANAIAAHYEKKLNESGYKGIKNEI